MKSEDSRQHHLFDINQEPDFQGGTQEIPGALLRKSRIWSLKAQREMMPCEKMGVQGFQVYMD